MSPWINVAVSYLPDILALTKPLFTRAKTPAPAPELMEQQIAELQAAATQNAESIKQLAADMQRTIDAMQATAVELERRLARTQLLLAISFTGSVIALLLAAWLAGQR